MAKNPKWRLTVFKLNGKVKFIYKSNISGKVHFGSNAVDVLAPKEMFVDNPASNLKSL
jgi:hypothetical protein